jgi:hypothetical protein
MAMRHRPDDVLGPESGVAAEEHFGIGGLHGGGTDLGHVPFVEFQPISRSIQGKAFSWPTATSTSSHSITTSGSPGRDQAAAALGIEFGFDLSNFTPSACRRVQEFLGHQEIVDRDAFMHRVFFFPGARLHFLESRSAPPH